MISRAFIRSIKIGPNDYCYWDSTFHMLQRFFSMTSCFVLEIQNTGWFPTYKSKSSYHYWLLLNKLHIRWSLKIRLFENLLVILVISITCSISQWMAKFTQNKETRPIFLLVQSFLCNVKGPSLLSFLICSLPSVMGRNKNIFHFLNNFYLFVISFYKIVC